MSVLPVVREFLDDAVVEGIRRPVAEARGLPGRLFTDAGFLALEQKALFPRSWFAAAFAHDIPEPGDALPLTLFGLPVVLVRGRDRQVRAFHNVCRHRGTKVVLEPQQGASVLKCFYHCWVYDLEGRLRGTPMWDGTANPSPDGLDKAANGLVPIRCTVMWGVVYLNLDGAAAPLEDYFGFLTARYRGCDFDALRPAVTAHWEMDANWKLGVEGVIEGYHEPYVHPQLPPRTTGADAPLFVPRTEGNVFGTTIAAEGGYDLSQFGGGFPPLSGPGGGKVGLDIFVLFPNGTVVVAPDHLLHWIWTPLSVDRTRVSVTLFLEGETATSPVYEAQRQKLFAFWDEVMRQDGMAVQAQQEARRSPVSDDIKFSPFWEGRVHHFERRIVDTMLA